MKNNVKLNVPHPFSFVELGGPALYGSFDAASSDILIKVNDSDVVNMGKVKNKAWEADFMKALQWIRETYQVKESIEITLLHQMPEIVNHSALLTGIVDGVLNLIGLRPENHIIDDVLGQLNEHIPLDANMVKATLNGGWCTIYDKYVARIYAPRGLQYVIADTNVSMGHTFTTARILAFQHALNHSDFEMLSYVLKHDLESSEWKKDEGYLGKLQVSEKDLDVHIFNHSDAVDRFTQQLSKNNIGFTLANAQAEGITYY